MSKILTDNQYYSQIADVIREQNGTNNTYTPPQMVNALKDLFYEEVEGVPPISFNGIGENLLNYRIDGASGGVGDRTNNLFDKKNTEIIHAYFSPENLWQVNEDSSSIIIKVRPNTQYTLSIGTAISIFRIYKTSLENPEPGKNNVFTPIIRSSNINTYTFTTDNDTTYIIFQGTNADTEMWINSLILNIGSTSLPSYEPYGYKVPVVISGKNLFNEIYPNIAINTVKYISFALTNGEYTLSSNIPNGGSASLFLLAGQVNSGASTQNNGVWLNNPQTVNVIDGFLTIGYRIYGNMNPEDYETILVLGSTATNYEPYHEPTTTNIYLDEPIGENESISLSDTNTNIPTIRGTNVLTVDTTIQPSNVYVKARKESQYETIMRERYEEAQAQLDALESGGE